MPLTLAIVLIAAGARQASGAGPDGAADVRLVRLATQDESSGLDLLVRPEDRQMLVAGEPPVSGAAPSVRPATAPILPRPTPVGGVVIPPKDEFGLPAPVWLFEFLLPASFFVHVLFMSVAVGTAVLALPLCLAGRKRPHLAAVFTRLMRIWPVVVSLTITTGVAPLLFVQALYGHLFYPTNILLGWVWLSVIMLLLILFYSVYFVRGPEASQKLWCGLPACGEEDKTPAPNAGRMPAPQCPPPASPKLSWPRTAMMMVILLGVLAIAAIFTANSTLMVVPERWQAVRAGTASAMAAHPMFWPRLAHNVGGAIAVTGLFIAILGRVGRGIAEADRTRIVSFGLLLAMILTSIQILSGVWFIVTIFHEAVSGFHSVSGVHVPAPGAILWAAAVLTGISSVVYMMHALNQPERGRSVWVSAGLILFTLAGMSAGRERVRIGMLHAHLDALYSSADVRQQSITVWLFIATAVMGLAVIGVMVRWMVQAAPRRAEP